MKKFLLAAVSTAALTSAASAATIDIDFIDLIDGVGGVGEMGVDGQTFTFGGVLDITITSNNSSTGMSDAYFDGGGAGLGVCSDGLSQSSQCLTPSDDNVTAFESVTLTFSGAVVDILSNFTFRGANHGDLSASNDTYLASAVAGNGDTGGPTSLMFSEKLFLDASAVVGFASFTFAYGGISENEFYLSGFTADVSQVPLPASILLLGGAIGGMGAMRRRRKAA